MKILHLLNIADYFFMAAGLGVALLMIVMGGGEERRKTERVGRPDSTAKPDAPPRRRTAPL